MENNDDCCCICLTNDNFFQKTKCNHIVCVPCFKQIKIPRICPLCRARYNKPIEKIKCPCGVIYDKKKKDQHIFNPLCVNENDKKQFNFHLTRINQILKQQKKYYFSYTKCRIGKQFIDNYNKKMNLKKNEIPFTTSDYHLVKLSENNVLESIHLKSENTFFYENIRREWESNPYCDDYYFNVILNYDCIRVLPKK